MNSKNRKTLEAIFRSPTPASVKWRDIEALFEELGADVREGRGSRVRITLGSSIAVFHRPHPSPNTDKGAVKSVRRFLESEEITP